MLYFQHLKESTWFCLECSVSSVKPISCCTYVINGADIMLYIRNQRGQHCLLYLPPSPLPVFPSSFFLFFLSLPSPHFHPAPVALGNLPPFVCTHSCTRRLYLSGCIFLVFHKSPVCTAPGSRPLRHGGGEVPYLPSRCCSHIT